MRIFYLLFFLWAQAFPAFAMDDASEAEYQLGMKYALGDEVAQDYARAFEYYSKAAEKNHVAAQYELGVLYRDGKGVARDYNQARYWYEKAAEQGNMSAQYNLAQLHLWTPGIKGDYAQGKFWLEKVAEQGDVEALTDLGDLYVNGSVVAAKDYARAIEFYTQAAERNYAPAQYILGLRYFGDEEGEQDLQKSQYWLERLLAQIPDDDKKDREEIQQLIDELKMMQNQPLRQQDRDPAAEN